MFAGELFLGGLAIELFLNGNVGHRRRSVQMLFGDRRFYDWRAAINLVSRRYDDAAQTAYPAEGIGYEDGAEVILAAELGSDETSPESELPAGPAWDEQAVPTAFADGVASEPSDARQ